MKPEQAQAVAQLLASQEIGALGTLHDGEPFVSMVPFAALPGDDPRLVVHVSRLATHTKDMLTHPGVSLMVMAERTPDVSAQALARATFQGQARPCPPGDPQYEAARHAYLTRFPQSEPMFDFADFSLFLVEPRSVRFVGGFAQAWSAVFR